MTVITIGAEVKNRAASPGFNKTLITLNGPADGTGSLDTMIFWAWNDINDLKAGTFSGSGTDYNDRDYETIGFLDAGAATPFTGLNCSVTAGDFMGIYYSTSGGMENDISGYAGIYYIVEDTFGQGVHTYTLYAGDCLSINATGFLYDPYFSYYPHILAH